MGKLIGVPDMVTFVCNPHCLMAESNIKQGVGLFSTSPSASGIIVGYNLFGFTLMYAYDGQDFC